MTPTVERRWEAEAKEWRRGSTRVATRRGYADPKAYDAIDQDARGVLFWTAEEGCGGARLPVTLDFVRDFFRDLGRELEIDKLPVRPIENPYRIW